MPERVVIDTNVVITAFDPTRPGHHAARTLLESDPRAISVTHQSLREFLAVTTRPERGNGYGLTGPVATSAWRALTATLDHLAGSHGSQSTLTTLVESGLATGPRIHDANLVAVALEHDAARVVTGNLPDFEPFAHLISVEPLG